MSRPADPVTVTPELLRDWPLPEPGSDKYSRGQVLVVGGARSAPGAALLAGLAALRVGAGRLTVAVAESVATATAVAVPEAGVVALPENTEGAVLPSAAAVLADQLERADAVLVGSGLDDAFQTGRLLDALHPLLQPVRARLVLDAFALGALTTRPSLVRDLPGRVVLTPNPTEAAHLLQQDELDDDRDLPQLVERYPSVVTAQGTVVGERRRWRITAGGSGLGTSGSGDVLAGAITGLLARGADPEQAAVWGTHLHARAGDLLGASVGPLGFLARELVDALPRALAELDGG